MTSIFQRTMRDDFDRLHPQLQRRFGIGLDSGQACVGTGTMDRIWHGRGFTRPFLWLGSTRNILVPTTGRDIPFRIDNYPYRDEFGREAVSFVRTFGFARRRRFDATMVHHPDRGTIVDYLGTHQHLAADLRLRADPEGALVITSQRQVFLQGPIRVRVPALVTGSARVRESFDDTTGRFTIDVRVDNHRFGPLFGYHGTFTASFRDLGREGVPAAVKPRHTEVRW